MNFSVIVLYGFGIYFSLVLFMIKSLLVSFLLFILNSLLVSVFFYLTYFIIIFILHAWPTLFYVPPYTHNDFLWTFVFIFIFIIFYLFIIFFFFLNIHNFMVLSHNTSLQLSFLPITLVLKGNERAEVILPVLCFLDFVSLGGMWWVGGHVGCSPKCGRFGIAGLGI